MMDITNSTESYNSQFRKVLKGKRAFQNDTAVMKLIYIQTMSSLAENEVNHSQLLGNGGYKEIEKTPIKLESNIKPIIDCISG